MNSDASILNQHIYNVINLSLYMSKRIGLDYSYIDIVTICHNMFNVH